MLKKFFSSAWPTVVALCVGAVTFLVGNFFGHYLPEGWLVPLAWVSAVALCVAAVLAGIYAATNSNKPWIVMSFALTLCGALINSAGFILVACNWFDPAFVDPSIFCYPIGGPMIMGLVLGGMVFILSLKKGDSRQYIILVLFIGVTSLLFGLVMGSLFWVLRVSDAVRICLSSGMGVVGVFVILMLKNKVLTIAGKQDYL